MAIKVDIRETRKLLRERCLACEKCELRKKATNPVPFFGPTPADIAVIGEAPGRAEDKEGQPFIGPSGSLLKTIMKKVGLSPAQMLWVNTVQCWPDGEPKDHHIDACHSHRWEPIALAEPTSILLVGKKALSTIRPDLSLSDTHGRPLHWAYGDTLQGRVQHWTARVIFWPIYHPSGALKNPKVKEFIQDDLRTFAVLHKMGFHRAWPMDCVICGDKDPSHVDHQGVYWCEKHWQRQLSLFGRKANV